MIGDKFVGVDALELMGWKTFRFLEFPAKRGSEWASLHFPEFGHRYARGVHFQGCAHRGIELGVTASHSLGGIQYEQGLIGERVYRIDHIIVIREIVITGRGSRVEAMNGRNVGLGVNVEQTALHHLDLDLAYGSGECRHLAVDIGYSHAIGIHNGEMGDTGAHKSLGCPASDTSHAEYYHLHPVETAEGFIAYQPGGAIENQLSITGGLHLI